MSGIGTLRVRYIHPAQSFGNPYFHSVRHSFLLKNFFLLRQNSYSSKVEQLGNFILQSCYRKAYMGQSIQEWTKVEGVPVPPFLKPLDLAYPSFLKSLFPLTSFLFHPLLRYFRKFLPPSRNPLLP